MWYVAAPPPPPPPPRRRRTPLAYQQTPSPARAQPTPCVRVWMVKRREWGGSAEVQRQWQVAACLPMSIVPVPMSERASAHLLAQPPLAVQQRQHAARVERVGLEQVDYIEAVRAAGARVGDGEEEPCFVGLLAGFGREFGRWDDLSVSASGSCRWLHPPGTLLCRGQHSPCALALNQLATPHHCVWPRVLTSGCSTRSYSNGRTRSARRRLPPSKRDSKTSVGSEGDAGGRHASRPGA